MIGIILVLSVGFLEKLSMFFLIQNSKYQEIKIILNYIFIIFIFLIYSFLFIKEINYDFLNDKLFYITLIIENIILFVSLQNYNKQKNFTQISFAAFSTLYIIIILGAIYPTLLNIETVYKSPYKNTFELIIYSLIFFILTLAYFYDKIKNTEILFPKYLIFYAFLLSNGLYFAVSLLQKYQSTIVYSIIFFTFIIQQLIWYKTKRRKIIPQLKLIKQEKNIIINTILYLLLSLSAWVFSVIGALYLKVEFFAIFKRTGSIISALIIDKYINKREITILFKDIIIVLIIILIGFYLKFR